MLLLLLASSCAGGRPAQPVSKIEPLGEASSEADKAAAKTLESHRAPAAPTAAEVPAAGPAADEPEKRGDATTIEIESGSQPRSATVTLVEASRAEKERRAKPSRTPIVITNKTLSQYNKGKVTFAQPAEKAQGAASGEPAEQGADYWQKRGLEIRQRWHDNTERVHELEQTAADLRRKFYGENDTRVRDLQIKPDWDRALDELRAARIAVETARKDLTHFLDDGRAAGALPGWLREGSELEPPAEAPAPAPTEAIEPPILKIDGRG